MPWEDRARTVRPAVHDGLADGATGHATARVRLLPAVTRAEPRPADSTPPILPGSEQRGDGTSAPFAGTARAFPDAGVPAVAIHGAVGGPVRDGPLDDRARTAGGERYAVAGPTGREAFACPDASAHPHAAGPA